MVNVPSQAERQRAYEQAIGAVPAKYQAGIQATQGWKEAAIAGQGLYEERMRDPEVLGKRARALERVNEAEWKNNAATKGSQRIASGMQAGAAKQAANYEPIAQAIRAVNLPARSADPMQNIDARVKPIVQAAVNASRGR